MSVFIHFCVCTFNPSNYLSLAPTWADLKAHAIYIDTFSPQDQGSKSPSIHSDYCNTQASSCFHFVEGINMQWERRSLIKKCGREILIEAPATTAKMPLSDRLQLQRCHLYPDGKTLPHFLPLAMVVTF